MVNKIEKYQNNSLKHLKSINRIFLQAFKYKPAARRDRGSPSRRWKDKLHLEM
jgi:hypothetical protein